MNKQVQGRISRFGHKGFGFIVSEDGKEYFLHQNDIKGSHHLRQNDEVFFIPDQNERGLIAREVQLIKTNSNKNQIKHGKSKGILSAFLKSRSFALLLIISIAINLYLIFSQYS